MTDTKTEAAQTVATMLAARRVFPNLEAAGVALAAIAAEASDFADVPFLAPGASFNEAGEFIPTAPEWTAETHEIMLARLGTKARKNKAGETIEEAKTLGIVFCPIPTVQACMEHAAGVEEVFEVWRKEMNHRAVRKLRNAENMTAAVGEMPLSIESYVTSQSGGGTSGLAPWDKYQKDYSEALAERIPAWNARFNRGLGKAAIRAAVENAARARAIYPELEEAGLFARLLGAIIKRAAADGMDVSLLQSWLDTRDQQTYDAETEVSLDSDALDDLFADLASDEDEGDVDF